MATSKLLEKLRALLQNPDKADKEHIKKLGKVLKKLKKRQQKLAEQLQHLDGDDDRQKIEQEIEVLRLQRHKGVEVYKRLKEAREERKKSAGD